MSDALHTAPLNEDFMLLGGLADLQTIVTPAFAQKHVYSAARRQLRSSYNKVSDALDRALDLDGSIWECAWPGGLAPSEQMITDALFAVMDATAHGSKAITLRLQETLLARCPAPFREYYRERPMKVVPMPRGRLVPDLLLDGRSYDPDPPVPNMFVGEVKYMAGWQVPYAGHLFGKSAGDVYDPVALWGIGHDGLSGQRVPHVWGTRADCGGFWHNHVGGGLWVSSAVQLDVYAAYAAEILRDVGVLDDHGATLRVWGLLVDAWAREVEADLAVTWQRWTTVSFADLLAGAYEALSVCNPESAVANRLKILLARLLWL